MSKNWSDRADRDLFFTILSVKHIGVISGAEWLMIGNRMRTFGYGFTNEGCRQHFQGLRRAQNKSEINSSPASLNNDPGLNPITRRPGPRRGRSRKHQSATAEGSTSSQPPDAMPASAVGGDDDGSLGEVGSASIGAGVGVDVGVDASVVVLQSHGQSAPAGVGPMQPPTSVLADSIHTNVTMLGAPPQGTVPNQLLQGPQPLPLAASVSHTHASTSDAPPQPTLPPLQQSNQHQQKHQHLGGQAPLAPLGEDDADGEVDVALAVSVGTEVRESTRQKFDAVSKSSTVEDEAVLTALAGHNNATSAGHSSAE